MPTPSAQRLSQTEYLTDGVTTVWNFSFSGGYLLPAHVKAYVEDAGTFVRTAITVTTGMLIGTFQLQITPALPVGGKLVIYRDTPKELPLVDFSDGSGFTEVSLDTSAKQAVFIGAEAFDLNGSAEEAALAASAAQVAAIAAQAASVTAQAAANSINLEAIPHTPSGTGAVATTVQTKLRRVVDVFDNGAVVGDGVADDSAAIQATIDAHKGQTIIFPAGYTYLLAGILLSGSSYANTKLVIEGTVKLKASGGGANFQSITWCGIILHDVDGCSIDVAGMFDGNRSNQPDSQGLYCIMVAGATNYKIPRFNCQEIRGDGIAIYQKTLASSSTVPKRGYIGPCNGYNSADDGRNLITIISCDGLNMAGGTSYQIGGTVGAARMPGGIDIEPDQSYHTVKGVKSGPWVVTTAGTSGIAIIGKAVTNDATRDWNTSDITFENFSVTQTAASVGGPTFQRAKNIKVTGGLIRTGGRSAGIDFDYLDIVNADVFCKGASAAVTVGFVNFVKAFKINITVEDHSAGGLLAVGVENGLFTGNVIGGQGAGSYGVQVSVGGRGTVTQTGVTYSVNVPSDASNTFGFLTAAGLTFTNCQIANCDMVGYAGYAVQVGLTTFLPSRNVNGRNFAIAMPPSGYWAIGDRVQNSAPAVGQPKGWYRITNGLGAVLNTDWVSEGNL